MPNDTFFMGMALDLGRRMLGQAAPNPAVGCIIVKDGRIAGIGTTQTGGRPHAETEALKQAGDAARGATAYVSLEPCAHIGKTGSCAEALIKAGVARVVAPIEDPDIRVSGKGFQKLRDAGIEVTTGILAEEAEFINEGFLKRVRLGRPMFTLKLAVSEDGRIATGDKNKPWISGEVARGYAHLLRANHDAVMVGIGTVLADDPLLSCRLPGLEAQSPIRIVMDSKLRLPLDSRLVKTAGDIPLYIVTTQVAAPKHEAQGAKIITVPANAQGHCDSETAAKKLGAFGLTRVLIEGGAELASAFISQNLVDRVEWVTAPVTLGGPAMPAMAVIQKALKREAGLFKSLHTRQLSQDRLESFVRAG